MFGVFATQGDESHDVIEVVSVLVQIMERFLDNEDVQMSALQALRSIHRQQAIVFGMRCSQEPIERVMVLDADLYAKLEQNVTRALQNYPDLCEIGMQVICRSLAVERAVALATTSALQTTLLNEVYYSLEEALTIFRCNSDPAVHKWASAVLQNLAQQCPKGAGRFLDSTSWFEEVGCAQEMQPRMLLKGTLLGCMNGLIKPFQAAVRALPRDDNTLTATFRAVSEMSEHNLRSGAMPQGIAEFTFDARHAELVSDCAVELGNSSFELQRFVRSALAGALGTLNRGRGSMTRSNGQQCAKLDKVFKGEPGGSRSTATA